MCGNFGLLKLSSSTSENQTERAESPNVPHAGDKNLSQGRFVGESSTDDFHKNRSLRDSQRSLHDSMHEVSNLRGIRLVGQPAWTHGKSQHGMYDLALGDGALDQAMLAQSLSPLDILKAQTSCTEVRGGQAGGYSTIEYHNTTISHVRCTRVRCVARKRHPLAADLAKLYLTCGGRDPDPSSSLTGFVYRRSQYLSF